MPTDPVLVVHGGAWAMPDDMVEAHIRGVKHALAAGWRVLERGGPALDAVEEAVVIMEDDETFDAGRGSFLNRDGKVQLDALIMEGSTLRAGGVGCVEHIRNPVRAAKKILTESPLYTEPIEIVEGQAIVPERPGWGFSLDPKALQRYAAC